MGKLLYLNLGCGSTYNKDWTNIDFVSQSESVIAHNLLDGIPCPDKSFTVVYHSHVLEHFPKEKALGFIQECYRVLQPGGLIRIAIPDLEKIALNYVKYLNESLEGVQKADQKYDWTMLELFDQIVRSSTGGEMIKYIKDESINNDDFLLKRNGYEVKRLMEIFRVGEKKNSSESIVSFPTLKAQLKKLPKQIKRKFIHFLLGNDYKAYQSGLFRFQGEIHQWMYDRYSLKRLLETVGFNDIQTKTAFESAIPEWKKFNLDGTNGEIRKPDSLFMEAIK